MNIYHISQTENNDYDTYDSAIVCAKTEDDARKIHPSGDDVRGWDHRFGSLRGWCSSPELVTVRVIGRAFKDVKPGVILASFNAG